MLELQKFLLTHPNDWKQLLSRPPYSLRISEDGNLVLFKYSQIDSDFNEEIVNEARGIILEKNTWRVVRYAFKKFFNYQEPFAARIDWNSATASSKEDGSLISLYWYDDKWNIATNGTIDAYKAKIDGDVVYENFGELFQAAAKNCHLSFDSLNTDYCYTFELCSAFNRVILEYKEPQIFHIGTRDLRSLQEIEVDIGVQKPKAYDITNEKSCEELVESLNDKHHEGIVVRDKFYNRIKMKTTSYFALHHVVNNHKITAERALDLIRTNEHGEFLSYFPCYAAYFNDLELQYKNALISVEKVKDYVEVFKATRQDKRQFATQIKDFDLKPIYFAIYDGKWNEDLSNLTSKQMISLFHFK